jgi:hypothetical protein
MPLPAEQWPRVKQLFDAAVELDADQRQELIDRECAGDGDLRREVESLLAADDGADDFIETPAAASPAYGWSAKEESFVGRQFGAYRVIDEIGRGGLGTVYLARGRTINTRNRSRSSSCAAGSIQTTSCRVSAPSARSSRSSITRTSRA